MADRSRFADGGFSLSRGSLSFVEGGLCRLMFSRSLLYVLDRPCVGRLQRLGACQFTRREFESDAFFFDLRARSFNLSARFIRLCLRPFALSGRLAQLNLILDLVDLKQHIAGLDEIAVLEPNPSERTPNLRTQLHLIDGGKLPKKLKPGRQLSLKGFAH